MKTLTLILILLAFFWPPQAHAQRLLVPGYDAGMARLAVETAREHGVGITLIFNPDSGPGQEPAKAYVKLAKHCRKHGVPMLAYVDLVDWSGAKARVRTAAELSAEVKRYREFYGTMSGWFCDDLWPSMVGTPMLAEPTTWRGELVGNPGCSLPKWPAGFDCIITHEGPMFCQQAKLGRGELGALALELPDRELESAWAKARTAGLRYFYATELPDNWQKGQTAYNRLPGYWQRLLQISKQR